MKVLPKFVYDVPTGNNPAGVILSLERRRHLLQIASKYDLLILEDDPYQLIQLEDRDPIPTLQSMDREDRVVRLDSFSKIFAPGLRLGYASGPAEIIGYFQLYKQGLNIHTSAMDQTLLAALFANHSYEEFRALIRENCIIYRRNRDAMIEAARKHLPADIRYNTPAAGMFLWFEMPRGFDAERMVETDGMDAGRSPDSRQQFFDCRQLEKLYAGQLQHDYPGAGGRGHAAVCRDDRTGENPNRPLKTAGYFS